MFVSSWLCVFTISTFSSNFIAQCGAFQAFGEDPFPLLDFRGGKGKGSSGNNQEKKSKKYDKEAPAQEIDARIQLPPYPPYPPPPYPHPQYPPYQPYPQYPYPYPPQQYPIMPPYPPPQFPNAPYPPPIPQQLPPQGQQQLAPQGQYPQPPQQPPQQTDDTKQNPLSAIVKGSITTNIKQHNTFAPTFGNIGDFSLGKFLFGDAPDPDMYDEDRPMQDVQMIHSFLVGKIDIMKNAVASLMGGDGEDHAEDDEDDVKAIPDDKGSITVNNPVLGREYNSPVLGRIYNIPVLGREYNSPVLGRVYNIPVLGREYNNPILGREYSKQIKSTGSHNDPSSFQQGKYSPVHMPIKHKYPPPNIYRNIKKYLKKPKGRKCRYPHSIRGREQPHQRRSKYPPANLLRAQSPKSRKVKPEEDSKSSSSSASDSYEGWN